MKKFLIPLFLLVPLLVTGCNKKSDDKKQDEQSETDKDKEGEGGGEGGEGGEEEAKITVNFYVDFNQKVAKNVYYVEYLKLGDKIVKPEDPTSPIDPAYPVFKGWSRKEVIDNLEDLYDFNTVLTEDNVPYTNVVDVFGIWVAQGE